MEKHEKIIDASIKLFLENGIEKTSVQHIAKEAGMAPGTFYLYFPTKLAVMPSIAERMVSNIKERLCHDVTNQMRLDEVVTSIIDAVFRNTKEFQSLTLLIYSGFTRSSEVKSWESIYTPLYDWLTNILKGLQEKGEITSEIDLTFTSRIIIGAVEQSSEQVYLYDTQSENYIEDYKVTLHHFIISSLIKK